MKGLKLSPKTIQALVAPHQGDTYAWFQELPGFGIRISATGRKAWVCQFRLAGKSKRVTLGDVRVVAIPQAKERARAILAAAEQGRDLVADGIAQKARQQAQDANQRERTIGAIIGRYLAEPAVRRRRSCAETERYLTKVWQAAHELAAETCTRHELVPILRQIAAQHGEISANRARSALSGLFSYAIEHGWLMRDETPTRFLPQWEEKSRDRVLSVDELGKIWQAAPKVNPSVGAILRLLVLSGSRKTEISELRWSELDLEAAEIRLPGTRTKNNRAHVIPLPPVAVEMLTDWPRTSSPLLFPSIGWTHVKVKLDQLVSLETPWTIHDLRRSFVTGLSEHVGADRDLIELCVNHASGSRGGVAGTYQRSERLAERRRALERWTVLVLRAAGQESSAAKVVRLRP